MLYLFFIGDSFVDLGQDKDVCRLFRYFYKKTLENAKQLLESLFDEYIGEIGDLLLQERNTDECVKVFVEKLSYFKTYYFNFTKCQKSSIWKMFNDALIGKTDFWISYEFLDDFFEEKSQIKRLTLAEKYLKGKIHITTRII